MIEPKPQASPYDSCHHKETTQGDSFGGLGTDKEYHEESVRAQAMAARAAFLDHGTASASANPRIRDPYERHYFDRLAGVWRSYTPRTFAHEITHNKP